ncbi:hypothetical protein V866_003286 [Kwoniella sp. B9012]|uniref:Uncharacterized protein n=1 Tax=Kwoniella europaea PYCC6329 TaxID=1423913 RepID=A0AAX4KGN4_9TREE
MSTQNYHSASSETSSLQGSPAYKHTIDLSTTYHNSTYVPDRPLGGPHTWSFTSCIPTEHNSAEVIQAFQRLSSALKDDQGNINFENQFHCVLRASEVAKSGEWEGYISEKGLRNGSTEPLVLFSRESSDGPHSIKHIAISPQTRKEMLRLMLKTNSSANKTRQIYLRNLDLGLSDNDDKEVSVDISLKTPLLYSRNPSERGTFVALTTKAPQEGGWPAAKGEDSIEWTEELRWWEVVGTTAADVDETEKR